MPSSDMVVLLGLLLTSCILAGSLPSFWDMMVVMVVMMALPHSTQDLSLLAGPGSHSGGFLLTGTHLGVFGGGQFRLPHSAWSVPVLAGAGTHWGEFVEAQIRLPHSAQGVSVLTGTGLDRNGRDCIPQGA